MYYNTGEQVKINDVINASYGHNQFQNARIVIIGKDTYADDVDLEFYSWAVQDGIIDDSTIVIEWIGENPLAHDDPNYAPVGEYMILSSLCCESFICRADNSEQSSENHQGR